MLWKMRLTGNDWLQKRSLKLRWRPRSCRTWLLMLTGDPLRGSHVCCRKCKTPLYRTRCGTSPKRVIKDNFIGESTIEAEFWADTLDRWAEQLVDPLPEGGPPAEMGLVELPNLPPEIVVEVMRIINREIQLREETRELEQAKAAISPNEYSERSIALYDTQITLTEDTREVEAQISLLPNAQEGRIQGQLAKVGRAAAVMEEVEDIFAEPDTGPKAIAAITEVIEILLETGRIPNAPIITTAPPATASALSLLGIGDDSGKASIENRSPRQATGKTGRVLPEEFRQGLDAYFDALEGRTQ